MSLMIQPGQLGLNKYSADLPDQVNFMDKKTKKRIDVLQQKITKLQRLLAAEKEQPDDPAEIPRIEAELAKAHTEMSSLKSD